MRITLVYMGVGVAGFNPDRPPGDREGSWISHGVASVGAALKAHGHKVRVIDMRQLDGWAGFASLVLQDAADVYGISVSPVDSEFLPMTAQLIKHLHPRSTVVVGGIHPTLFPNTYAACSHVDVVITGEGEVSFPAVLAEYAHGRQLPRIVHGVKPELDYLPWADRSLFQYERELSCTFAPDQRTPSITMLAGRGCPFRCTYCQPAENAVFGKPHRMRSVHDVISELQGLYLQHAFKSVTFWDDTFTLSKTWVHAFCDAYEKTGIGATIAACSRADIVCRNEDMVARLAEVGVDWLVIGFESGSQRVLDFLKKGTTVEQNLKAARVCRKHGIKIFGTYMFGLPTETNEEALATARMIDEIRPEHASPFFFRPIPGTEIYTFCQQERLLLEDQPSVARTGVFTPSIRGVDYDFLNSVRCGHRA